MGRWGDAYRSAARADARVAAVEWRGTEIWADAAAAVPHDITSTQAAAPWPGASCVCPGAGAR